jgi:hypothetical protein
MMPTPPPLRPSRHVQKIIVAAPIPGKHLRTHPEDRPRRTDTLTMKLNVKNIRYLAADDWRVLTAVCARAVFPCVVGD